MADEQTKTADWECNYCGATENVTNGFCKVCGPTQTTPLSQAAKKEAGIQEDTPVEGDSAETPPTGESEAQQQTQE